MTEIEDGDKKCQNCGHKKRHHDGAGCVVRVSKDKSKTGVCPCTEFAGENEQIGLGL